MHAYGTPVHAQRCENITHETASPLTRYLFDVNMLYVLIRLEQIYIQCCEKELLFPYVFII